MNNCNAPIRGITLNGNRVEIPIASVVSIKQIESADWTTPKELTFSYTEIKTFDGEIYLFKEGIAQLRFDQEIRSGSKEE